MHHCGRIWQTTWRCNTQQPKAQPDALPAGAFTFTPGRPVRMANGLSGRMCPCARHLEVRSSTATVYNNKARCNAGAGVAPGTWRSTVNRCRLEQVPGPGVPGAGDISGGPSRVLLLGCALLLLLLLHRTNQWDTEHARNHRGEERQQGRHGGEEDSKAQVRPPGGSHGLARRICEWRACVADLRMAGMCGRD